MQSYIIICIGYFSENVQVCLKLMLLPGHCEPGTRGNDVTRMIDYGRLFASVYRLTLTRII